MRLLPVILISILLASNCFGQAGTSPVFEQAPAPCIHGTWGWCNACLTPENRRELEGQSQQPTQSPWQWSPNAKHHEAVVRVSAPNGGMGSGVQVNHRGLIGILTAAHIVGGPTLTVMWKDGYKATGLVTTDRYGDDIAWVFANRPNSTSVVFSDRTPQRGETIEYVGYGGPGITQGNLRHFYANATSFISNARVTFGDSGGPFFLDGKLIAIRSAGRGSPSRATDSRFPVFAGSVASDINGTRAFLDRVYTKYRNCPDGNCPPQGQPGGGGGYYYPPPQQPPIQQPYPQQQPPIVQQPNDECCKEALALIDDIKARIEEIRKMEGPPGKNGLPGKDGTNGVNGIDGKDGVDGRDGGPGPGIVSGRVGPNNELLVTLTDGIEYNWGVIKVDPSSIDVDYLAEQVIAKMPPRVIQYLDENNAVAVTSEPFPVDKPIKIPAFRVRTYSQDGKRLYSDNSYPYPWGARLNSIKEE